MEKNNFEETHNLYIVEEIDTYSLTTTDVKHNTECLDNMLDCNDSLDVKNNIECLDKVLDCTGNLSTTIDVKHNTKCLDKMLDCLDCINKLL